MEKPAAPRQVFCNNNATLDQILTSAQTFTYLARQPLDARESAAHSAHAPRKSPRSNNFARRPSMPFFLSQASYTPEALARLIANPQDRFDAVRGPIEKLGGRILQSSFSMRSEEHTSELQSRRDIVCRLLLEKKKKIIGLTNNTV